MTNAGAYAAATSTEPSAAPAQRVRNAVDASSSVSGPPSGLTAFVRNGIRLPIAALARLTLNQAAASQSERAGDPAGRSSMFLRGSAGLTGLRWLERTHWCVLVCPRPSHLEADKKNNQLCKW
jgi:hypothetical protein